eukprot:jgi/Hompol1/6907/HPOL_002391-RA
MEANGQARCWRVLEFYSGIGGFHAALVKAGMQFKLLSAFDMNENANAVYAVNHPTVPISTKNVGFLSAADLEAYGADMWLMAPPCQPYTRKGARLDYQDPRADSFLRLLDRLEEIQHRPSIICIENVFGFERSTTFGILKTKLESIDFDWQAFELNPLHFGIPYSRPRIFTICKQRRQNPVESIPTSLQNDPNLAPLQSRSLFALPQFNGKTVPSTDLPLEFFPKTTHPAIANASDLMQPLRCFLESNLPAEEEAALLISENDLWAAGRFFDIVGKDDLRCSCFTKAYGTYARGGGSVLRTDTADGWQQREADAFAAYDTLCQQYRPKASTSASASASASIANDEDNDNHDNGDNDQEDEEEEQQQQQQDQEQDHNQHQRPLYKRQTRKRGVKHEPPKPKWWRDLGRCPLASLRLRYFSAREVARLHGFPDSFQFASDTTLIQKFKMLGNSLQVDVVRMLLLYAVAEQS